MFPVTEEEMYAMHADRQREVARIVFEQTLVEAPVVRMWIAMQSDRVVRAVSRRLADARTMLGRHRAGRGQQAA